MVPLPEPAGSPPSPGASPTSPPSSSHPETSPARVLNETQISTKAVTISQRTCSASSGKLKQKKPGRASPENSENISNESNKLKAVRLSGSSQLPVQRQKSLLGSPPNIVRKVGKPLPLSHSFLKLHGKPHVPVTAAKPVQKHSKSSKSKHPAGKKMKGFATRVFENKNEAKKSQSEEVLIDLISFEENTVPVVPIPNKLVHNMNHDLLTNTFGDPVAPGLDANEADLINLN